MYGQEWSQSLQVDVQRVDEAAIVGHPVGVARLTHEQGNVLEGQVALEQEPDKILVQSRGLVPELIVDLDEGQVVFAGQQRHVLIEQLLVLGLVGRKGLQQLEDYVGVVVEMEVAAPPHVSPQQVEEMALHQGVGSVHMHGHCFLYLAAVDRGVTLKLGSELDLPDLLKQAIPVGVQPCALYEFKESEQVGERKALDEEVFVVLVLEAGIDLDHHGEEVRAARVVEHVIPELGWKVLVEQDLDKCHVDGESCFVLVGLLEELLLQLF